MSQIQLKMLTGPHADKWAPFESDDAISFGREQGNVLVLDLPYASRRHGDLMFHDGVWWLVNRSPNGTKLNGKLITDEPAQLDEGDVIQIGKQKVIEISFDASIEDEEEEEDGERYEEERGESIDVPKKSNKLWLLAAFYGVLMLGVGFMVLNPSETSKVERVPLILDDAIAAEIRSPSDLPADPREAIQKLNDARLWYTRLDSQPAALYSSHVAFKESLACSGKKLFDDARDAQMFHSVESRLIYEVTDLYRNGYALLRNHQWLEAETAFRELTRMYPNHKSELYLNVQRQMAIAIRHRPKRGFRR